MLSASRQQCLTECKANYAFYSEITQTLVCADVLCEEGQVPCIAQGVATCVSDNTCPNAQSSFVDKDNLKALFFIDEDCRKGYLNDTTVFPLFDRYY